jgi:hypothetical protein
VLALAVLAPIGVPCPAAALPAPLPDLLDVADPEEGTEEEEEEEKEEEEEAGAGEADWRFGREDFSPLLEEEELVRERRTDAVAFAGAVVVVVDAAAEAATVDSDVGVCRPEDGPDGGLESSW